MGKKIWKLTLVIIGIGFIIKGVIMLIGDPVEKDLLDYVNNHVVKLTSTEGRILNSYSAVTGSNYINDKILYGSLHDTIIPQYLAFIDTLKAVKPKTTEVQNLHNRYISGAEIQLAGFQQAMNSVEKEDAAGVVLANGKLNEAKKIFTGFNSMLDSLAAEHDVKLVKNEKK